MRNLHVLQTKKVQLDVTIVGHCIDADNRRFFVLTENVEIFEVQGDQQDVHRVALVSDPQESVGLTSIKVDEVILIEYVVEVGSICIILKTGKIIRFGVSSFSPPSCCIYSHSERICSAKLSPDQDLIALADTNNDVFILTADCSLVHSSNALTQSDSANKPVGVGWGSKETQFFGLDGRPSKEKADKVQIAISEEELSEIEQIESSDVFLRHRQENERSTVVDWRGDGQLLATLTFIPDSGKHYLKVWNRNLELQYMSEQLVTMERGLLSWVPNGQYVCTAQRRDNRVNEIAMFEKNGMVHQRITLPTFIQHLYIKDLLWSPDSAILAILVVQFNVAPQVQQQYMIMLYTMQNFHYYLKYSSYLTLAGNHYSFRWDPCHNNILYIASDKGSCIEYNCTSIVDHCQEDTTVAVIDANKILLTPFTFCNIPPPMSALVVRFETLINRIVVASRNFEQIFVITTDNKMIYRTIGIQENQPGEVKICIENDGIKQFSQRLGSFRKVDFEKSYEYQNFTLVDRYTMLATRRCESGSEIVQLHIDDNPTEPRLELKLMKVLEAREVISIVEDSYDVSSNSIRVLLDDFSCNQINLTTGEASIRFILKTTADRLYVRETRYIEQFNLVLTLTLDLTLRIDDHVVASNCCTSFRTASNFVIYTTIDHVIHFVPLDRLVSKRNQEEIGSWNQPIESGGTLILVSESDSKVVLQMPRGNLEFLHPRILVLLRIINHIDHEEYLSALKLARRYRVDLNFLADYMLRCDEQAFYETKLNQFANDIGRCDPTLLNLFITELSSDDTTKGRYKSALKYLPACNMLLNDEPLPSADKVNKICSAIKLPDGSEYLQPKLLCLIKQEPCKSELALRLIHEMTNKEKREATLKFILYFISIEQLFKDAIATYDTDIAIMVAGVSSKDPKEYLALLDTFNGIENIHLRRYKMDYHIKNYEKAFTNLLTYFQDSPHKDAVKTELLDIVAAKRIYRHAIKTCFDQFVNFVSLGGEQCKVDRSFEELTMEIWTQYGDYLLEKRYYLEAGLAYSKSLTSFATEKKLENAIKCFLLANDWERCAAAVERFKLAESRRKDVLKNISNNLLLQGEFAGSILVLDAPKNDELAFELVARGSWYLAELIISEKSRSRLREETSRAVCSDFDSYLSTLSKDLNLAREQYKRLKELLLTPPKTDHLDADNCYTADSLSTVDGSETTSLSSGGKTQGRVARSGAPSIKTRASTKSNKSQIAKRKKINLKVGSRHEDMALVIEMRKFISKQKSNQELVRHLIAAQIEFMNLTTLNKRHELINELLKQSYDLAKEILNNLWPKIEQEDNVHSVYRRFGKVLATGEFVDNADLDILLRPELTSSCIQLEF